MRSVELIDHGDEGGPAVQNREVALHEVGSHSHLSAVDTVANGDLRATAGLDDPAVLLGLACRSGVTLNFDPKVFNLSLVFPDEVRAGRPNRHHELDGRFAAGGINGLNFYIVILSMRKRELVANRRLLALGGDGTDK